MPKKGQVNPLSPAIKSISQLLKEDDVEGMIIGGLAASLLGRPRFTNNIQGDIKTSPGYGGYQGNHCPAF